MSGNDVHWCVVFRPLVCVFAARSGMYSLVTVICLCLLVWILTICSYIVCMMMLMDMFRSENVVE